MVYRIEHQHVIKTLDLLLFDKTYYERHTKYLLIFMQPCVDSMNGLKMNNSKRGNLYNPEFLIVADISCISPHCLKQWTQSKIRFKNTPKTSRSNSRTVERTCNCPPSGLSGGKASLWPVRKKINSLQTQSRTGSTLLAYICIQCIAAISFS